MVSLYFYKSETETQKKGGKQPVYIDTETSVSQEFLEVIGVDFSKMLYLHLETVEDIFDTSLMKSLQR